VSRALVTTDVAAAEALWSDLRSALANFDRVLAQIITARAWEPLGYDTFAQAWADRMRGTRLGTASMAAHVVYALIEDGLDREQALLTLGPSSGVGPAKYDVLARQHDAGVPPQFAAIIVRQHTREAPSAPHYVHVELTHDEWLHFRAVADGRGMDLADESAKAVRAHFHRLERRSHRGDR
jgi:hypothetical protein